MSARGHLCHRHSRDIYHIRKLTITRMFIEVAERCVCPSILQVLKEYEGRGEIHHLIDGGQLGALLRSK